MGKRIPKSRKHKKLKFVDPCYRGPQPRSKKKHLQFNEPPSNDDVQDAPRGMEEFIDLKNKLREGKIKRKKKKKKTFQNDFIVVKNQIVDKHELAKGEAVTNVPAVLKQNKNESEQQFFNRLQLMADKALAEAKVEEKYNIKLVSVDKDGNAQYKSLDKEDTETKKNQKRKNYKEKMREKKRLKTDDKDFELKKDIIQFGDVVSAPPTLSAKHSKIGEISKKPGKKNLALKELFQHTEQSDEKQTKRSNSMKWKDMSPDRKREMESERSRAVQMYRLLKSKRT